MALRDQLVMAAFVFPARVHTVHVIDCFEWCVMCALCVRASALAVLGLEDRKSVGIEQLDPNRQARTIAAPLAEQIRQNRLCVCAANLSSPEPMIAIRD